MLPALIAIGVMMLAATGSSPSPEGGPDEGSAADGGQRHADPEDVRRWVEQSRDGDMQAFRRLYDEFLPYVRHHVGRLVGPDDKVEDLVQEIFVEVYDSLSDFEFRSKFKTWLYRVTRNVTISHLRGREETIDLDDVRPLRNDSRMLAKLEARDQVRALYSVLEQCKPESREAFILHEVEEMKLREIAEMTDTSINTVGSRVRRTREKLRTFLETKLREEAP
jgi:RNA polymerase sigma-70 factor (ECF subfamily)